MAHHSMHSSPLIITHVSRHRTSPLAAAAAAMALVRVSAHTRPWSAPLLSPRRLRSSACRYITASIRRHLSPKVSSQPPLLTKSRPPCQLGSLVAQSTHDVKLVCDAAGARAQWQGRAPHPFSCSPSAQRAPHSAVIITLHLIRSPPPNHSTVRPHTILSPAGEGKGEAYASNDTTHPHSHAVRHVSTHTACHACAEGRSRRGGSSPPRDPLRHGSRV